MLIETAVAKSDQLAFFITERFNALYMSKTDSMTGGSQDIYQSPPLAVVDHRDVMLVGIYQSITLHL